MSFDNFRFARHPATASDDLRGSAASYPPTVLIAKGRGTDAAVKAGALKKGEKVRFGFHNLRHSLASFLVRKGTDVKTAQKMLRHSDVSTTLGIYAHSMSEDRLAAQVDKLTR